MPFEMTLAKIVSATSCSEKLVCLESVRSKGSAAVQRVITSVCSETQDGRLLRSFKGALVVSPGSAGIVAALQCGSGSRQTK